MNPIHLLSSRQLLPLFITQFLGACNDNIFKNALIIFIVYRLADLLGLNAQVFVALASGLFILPFFLFSPTAGQLADKYPKQALIVKIKMIEVILMPFAALGFFLNHIILLLTVLFLLGIQATFFGPLKYAILPELLTKETLLTGNGLVEAGTFIAILLGSILGGVVILHPFGKEIISVTLIVIAFLGWGCTWFIPKSTQYQPDIVVNFNLFQEIKSLYCYTYEQKNIFFSIIGISWFWLFGSTVLATLPQYTKTVLHADQNVVTFFFALFSVGLAVGSLICTKLSKKPSIHYIYPSLLGITVFTLDIFLSSPSHLGQHTSSIVTIQEFVSNWHNYGIILDFACIAIFGGLYTVPLYTLLQSKTQSVHRARVIAFNNIMNALFMIISALIIMGLAALEYPAPYILLLLALGTGIVTLLLYQRRHQLT